MTVYNAPDDAGFYYNETLGELRLSLLERLGYAAQAANPPPGMKELLNNFLIRTQNRLYRKYRALQTPRYYYWTMVPGERFYGILSNEDDSALKLNPNRILGVWVEDLNGVWLPVVRGINPSFFTIVNRPGIPARYEVRQTIEVFPAPSQAYTLRVKGHFGLRRFTEDEDPCTIDSDLLFMWALARAKNHYGQPDAGDVAQEANDMLRQIVAETHGDQRYIPGEPEKAPATKPIFLG